jgi:formate hydrogenlyase subunit 4
VTAAVAQVLAVALGAPLLTGLMRQVRARLEGRAGAGVLQPWRDLRKLARKQATTPHGTTWAFAAAPIVLAATAVTVAAVVPLAQVRTPLDGAADLIAVTALLALGTAALALAGLDSGTAFGGMGASREMTVMALAEPTLLLAVFALSVPAGSTNLGDIAASHAASPVQIASPMGLLAAVALAIAAVAESGRIPVDNPSTHLELTMIHEAMILEYSGPDLALIEWGAAMRTALFLGLWSALFLPWGFDAAWPVALALTAVKVALLGTVLAAAEVFMAKLRLFRVPELLAGSFLLALLAVAASFFLASGTTA